MTPEDTSKIVAAIDRNTDAINWSGASRAAMLCLLICAVVGCPPAKASHITHVPVAEQPLQYWHTQWVPADGGVYPLEVYAPALPRVELEPYVFVDIGDPPRLMETPEPGTAEMVMQAIVLSALFILSSEMGKARQKANKYQKALEQIQGKVALMDPSEIARKALEGSK